jgi:hypothetical protein
VPSRSTVSTLYTRRTITLTRPPSLLPSLIAFSLCRHTATSARRCDLCVVVQSSDLDVVDCPTHHFLSHATAAHCNERSTDSHLGSHRTAVLFQSCRPEAFHEPRLVHLARSVYLNLQPTRAVLQDASRLLRFWDGDWVWPCLGGTGTGRWRPSRPSLVVCPPRLFPAQHHL